MHACAQIREEQVYVSEFSEHLLLGKLNLLSSDSRKCTGRRTAAWPDPKQPNYESRGRPRKGHGGTLVNPTSFAKNRKLVGMYTRGGSSKGTWVYNPIIFEKLRSQEACQIDK